MRKVIVLGVMVMFSAVLASGSLVPAPAQADLPVGAGCPDTAIDSGTSNHTVSATKPAGAAANGVCINLAGTGGENNTAILKQNPPGCPQPTVGAGSSYVWADWGSNNCVDPGEIVTVGFKSIGSELTVNAVTWSLAGGGTQDGTAGGHVIGPGGGIAEPIVLDSESPAPSSDSARDYTAPIVAAAAVAAVLALAAGGWYVRRRLS